MPELIDRQSALSVCKEYGWIDDEDFIEGYNTAIKDIREAIKELPTINPEVRHGRLIESRYPNENKCSECGQVFWDDIGFIYPYDENGVYKVPNRCPECGCFWVEKMDGGADNG